MRLAIIIAPAAVAISLAATSSASSNRWTVEHYLTKETWHAFADVGAKNASPDDIYAAQEDLRTPEGHLVGVVNGYGINLRKPYVFFHWTASLPSGSITVDSAIDLKTPTATYPIEGGTGRYAAARGTVTIEPAAKKGSRVTIRYVR